MDLLGRPGTLQRQLSWLIAAAVLLALLTVGTILVPLAARQRRQVLDGEIGTTVQMLADNLAAAVDFDSREQAANVLGSLRYRSSISRAWILDAEDRLFQAYTAGADAGAGPPALLGEHGGFIYASAAITHRGETLGRLVLEDDRSTFLRAFWIDVIGLCVALLLAFVVLILFTARLSRRLSRPLSQLAQQAGSIAASEDYSQRARTDLGGEIGGLFRAFDQMLLRIQARDRALIEAKKASEQRAVEAERARGDLAITLDSIGDAFLACDAQGMVTRMNPVAEALTGWSEAAARGEPIDHVYDVCDADSGAAVVPSARELLKGRGGPVANAHLLLRARDGRRRPIADQCAPIRGEGGELLGAVIVARDIEKQLSLEERLRQGQKMEAIGQLAGGVAHDFNNLLTGILGYVQLLERRFDELELAEPGGRDLLNGIRQAAERAADLTRQLLAFSRRSQVKRGSVDLHEILRATAGILQHTLHRNIALQLNLDAEHTLVVGDSGQLQSALLNLGVNARDAMKAGGTLRFATRNRYLVATEAESMPFKPVEGRYVEVQVVDTGTGIEPNHLPHIFEPFFTTKKVGEGTGLGLSAVYGTMETHGGTILVDSVLGHGTTFTCLLPEAVATAPVREVPAGAGPALTGDAALVLVVDDEEMLRKVASGLFAQLGCRVKTAHNGHDGVRQFAQLHRDLAMVLLDCQMPGMDGQEAYSRMRQIDQQVPIVLTSGGSIDVAAFAGARPEHFLEKPYTLESLAAVVAAVRRSRAPGL